MWVVLTGTAPPIAGKPVTREDLIVALEKVKIYVRPKIDGLTDYLVASRFDTVKAKTAMKMNVPIVDYEHLYNMAAALGVFVIKNSSAPNKYVDAPKVHHVYVETAVNCTIDTGMPQEVPDFLGSVEWGDKL